MNAHVHPDPRLSETLASLSLATAPAGPRLERRYGKRPFLTATALVVLFAAAAAIYANGKGVVPLVWRSGGPGETPVETATTAPSGTITTSAAPTTPLPLPAPTVTGSGHVVALAQAAVHPRRGGTIVNVAADVGSTVAAGQVLVRLDDPDLRFAFRAAELARGRARLVLEARKLDADDARITARRLTGLAASGAVNGQAAREAATAAERATNLAGQAAQDLAESDLSVAKAAQAIAELTVAAPIAGIVTARAAWPGEKILAQVDARGDAPLFTIVDPNRRALDVDIAETALDSVCLGQRGEAVLDAFPDKPFAVTVERIAPVASAERGTVALRLLIPDPPPGIRPAMAARVSLLPPPNSPLLCKDTDR